MPLADQSPTSSDQDSHVGPLDALKQLAQIADATKTLIVAVGGIAVAILGVWKDTSWSFAFALIASILVVAVLGLQVWRFRHPKKLAGAVGEKDPRSILRSSLPFEHPPLPGRTDEAATLFEMVTARDYSLGALVGHFGSGKTSLVRSELLTRLDAHGYPVVYVRAPGSDAMTVTREAILGELTRGENARTAADYAGADLTALLRTLSQRTGKAVVLVYDQFDAFLLGRSQPQVHDAFVTWLRARVNDAALNVRFLFVIRDDLFGRFLALEALVLEGHTGASSYELNDLTPEDATRVLRQTVERGETAFEPGLIAELIRDLTDDGLVSPALLQIVATRLKQREAATLKQYQQEGEAPGILQAYVARQVADSGHPVVARAVLQVLVRAADGRSLSSHSLDELEAAVRAVDPECAADHGAQLLPILRQLTSARLVMRRCGEAYAVAYPLLQPCIMAALDELAVVDSDQTQQAVTLLRKYVADYRTDPRTRVPLAHLSQIKQYAPPAVRRQEPARSLIQKSETAGKLIYTGAAALAAVTLIIAFVSVKGLLGPWQAWELATRIAMQDPDYGHTTTPSAVAFNPQTNQIVLANGGNSGGLYRLTFNSGNLAFANRFLGGKLDVVEEANGGRFTALAFGSDGRSMVSGQDDGTIRLWRTDSWTYKELRAADRPPPESACQDPTVVALRYDGKGGRLFAAIACGRIEVWDTGGPTRLASKPLDSPIASSQIAISSDGTRIAVRQSPTGVAIGVVSAEKIAERIRVWTLTDRDLLETFEGPVEVGFDPILALGFDPANRLVVGTLVGDEFTLHYYRQNDGSFEVSHSVGRIQTEGGPRAIIGRDAQIVGISDGKRIMRFWDLKSRQFDELRIGEIEESYLSPNGSALVIARTQESPMFTNEWRLLHLTGKEAP